MKAKHLGLEVNFCAQLNHTESPGRGAGRIRIRTEIAVLRNAERCSRLPLPGPVFSKAYVFVNEVRMIEDIERLQSQLDRAAFGHGQILEQ